MFYFKESGKCGNLLVKFVHDIAEILLKLGINTNQSTIVCFLHHLFNTLIS